MLLYHNHSAVFPEEYNVYKLPAANKWTYWVIQSKGSDSTWYPFHLHGHDFYILAQGEERYNPHTVKLIRKNPPRRDTATLFPNGHLIIAFENENPGS
ncbi:hypothetical protein NUU61_003222 [Penicillium alfredii]|uniref:Plastocyanin-like domain-containing protein n=1 Tax=Penicillium alfredii TaxID=1506179 RepID=A0A9W9FTN2_9EURO|nr:uncharacterized protein NUU61_003222 [Penicillium alfredii]KAJ5105875.1 hypothetical protein NUU61_003222 [Penicillium alfredii]